jgi:ribonuclease HII
MLTLGIDEAGRGPVIGPLVMCGYLIDNKNIGRLRELGTCDSKLLTPAKREKLEKGLKQIANDMLIFSIPAKEIDRLRTVSNLNKAEIERMQQMINMLEPDRVVIDAPEANIKKFHSKISSKVKNKKIEIITENFADRNHIEVSAASVVAKVHRDREIARLHRKYGFFGTGYPSDDTTIDFLKNWIKMNKEFPDCVRKSWITAVLIKREKEQRTLR